MAALPKVSPLVWLGLAAAVAMACAAGLLVAGAEEPVPSLALVAAGLPLLGLIVAVNARLRLEGLGGEGLTAAAGVLGAALMLFARTQLGLVSGDVAAPGQSQGAVFLGRLEAVGQLLAAVWLVRGGRALRWLFAPSWLLGWGSLAAAAATATGALNALVRGAWLGGGPHGLGGILVFLPLVLWSLLLAAVRARGRLLAVEPIQE